jgi:hypothetical protein
MNAVTRFVRVSGGWNRRMFIALGAALLVLVAGCERPPKGSTEVTYHPYVLPIAISIRSDGHIEVKASAEFATPIGTFSIEQSLAHRDVPANDTLLVIRRSVQGVVKDTLVRIRKSVRMTFLVDGSADLTSGGNVAVVKLRQGVSGIRVREDRGDPGERRFSAEKVSTLPAPGSTTQATVSPTPTQSPMPTQSPTPTGQPTCDAADSTSCPSPTETSPTAEPEPSTEAQPIVSAEPTE